MLHMTVQQLLENSSEAEILDWVAYLNLEAREQERQQKIAESQVHDQNAPQKAFSIHDLPDVTENG